MNTTLSALGQDLWRASWQGGLFILLVFAVCRIFRKLPPASRFWLWWLACLQLPLRLLFLTPVALPLLPAQTTDDQPIITSTEYFDSSSVVLMPVSPAAEVVESAAALPVVPKRKPISPVAILMFGWGVGGVTVLVLATRRLIRTRRILGASEPAGHEATELAQALSGLLRLRVPTVRESDFAPCPFLSGWARPTIVLPTGFVESRDPAELRMTIAHELAHLKRRDLWLAGAPLLTQSLFFFHPLAWLAIRETSAACEEACDIEAMRLSGGSPSAYARLLLSSVPSEVPLAAMGSALGFRLLHRRITMLSQSTLLAQPNVRRGVTALLAIGAICSIPWTVTAQKAPPAPPAPAHKKVAAKHHAPTAPSKKTSPASVSYFIDERSGSLYMVTTTAHKTLTYKIGTHPKVAKASAKQNAPTIIRYYALPPTPTGAVMLGVPGSPAIAPAMTVAPPMIARPGSAPAALDYGVTVAGVPPTPVRTIHGSTLIAPPHGAVNRSGVAVLAPPPPQAAISTSAPVMIETPKTAVNVPSAAFTTSYGIEPQKVRLVTGNGNGFVTMDMHEIDVMTALRAVLKEAGVDFAIKSTVEHDKITCAANNVSWRTALQAIFAAARQNLTFREEGGVIVVLPKD